MADRIQRCGYCGTELTDGIPVCPNCGRDNSVPMLGARQSQSSLYRNEYEDDEYGDDVFEDMEAEEEETVKKTEPTERPDPAKRTKKKKKRKKENEEGPAPKKSSRRKADAERDRRGRKTDPERDRRGRKAISEDDEYEMENEEKRSGILTVLALAAIPVILLCLLIPRIVKVLPDPSLGGGLPFLSSQEKEKKEEKEGQAAQQKKEKEDDKETARSLTLIFPMRG